ncbi:O-fucosyltransferase family protein [Ruminiclostridium herbifermentans]|uniref:O-fucosyltransferase family protein n=1 Tax=Ruminiclostridium herbifermentans TaxID=2488810 RepID=A0A4U7JDQ3_9FIRM|nr:O-fucosyltransferase family protein [Ruminiclostridium herbifermentans]QNU66889.1 O-fucosyltransferase family protein [Ruminiclostridium herbifermentans]
MPSERFLLIKSWGCGFWSDVDHVMGQLLVAELTNRIPVIYWGTNSLYAESFKSNAFDLYFEPVSDYTIYDVIKPQYTYYPPIWRYDNVMVEDLDKITWIYRNLGDLMGSDANVVVSDVHYFVRPIINYITKDHWAYGMTSQEIYRGLFDKYIRLKPDIDLEIQEFFNANLRDYRPTLGVHIRGGDKVREVENLSSLNKRYHTAIAKFLDKYNIQRILLLTDCEDIVKDFIKRYGSKVVFTDCRRGALNATDNAPHLQDYTHKRRKGIEIIKDTYLASKCDFFIGNGYSNVSYTVKRLRDWQEDNIILFFRDLKSEIKLAKKRTKTVKNNHKIEEKKHKIDYPELYGGVNTYVN